MRIAVPARLRFEVFKRDKFTCKYCGATAPDVVLQADHIRPVADGGGNEILNLITSCAQCNGGKGAISLADTQVLDKQRAQLEELEERRQQLTMMLEWRDQLQGLTAESIEALEQRVIEKGGSGLSEEGLSDLRRCLKRFGFALTLQAIDESFDTYLRYDRDEPTDASWGKAFGKIAAVAGVIQQETDRPYLKRLFYIQGIIRNRTRARRYECIGYLQHLLDCGADIDEMERRAKSMHSFEDFDGPYDRWLESIGSPY